MTWVETESLSFTARHDDADVGDANRVLDRLEDLRLKLEERFDEVPGEITIVIHDNPAWLSAAHPLLPVVRWSAAPAGRRYLAGWPMKTEIHTLNDEWLSRRAAGEDSLRALQRTAERLYVQQVLAAFPGATLTGVTRLAPQTAEIEADGADDPHGQTAGPVAEVEEWDPFEDED